LQGENLRVAIIGVGKMGLVHAGILNVLPNVELVALCEKSSLIRSFSKKVFKGLEIVDDLKKLEGFKLDAVYVTTPIPSHFFVASAILENRISKNLFVEKTLAQTYEESKRLADLAQTHQSVTMVGYLRRFYVTFNKARELLQKAAIGRVEFFKAYAYSSDFLGLEKKTEMSSSRGGVLRDLGCHAIDLATWFFGDLEVNSAESKSNEQAADSVSFKVGGSQTGGEFDVSWCKKDYRMPEVGFSVTGSKGSLFVNDDQVKLESQDGKSLMWYRHDLNDNVPFWLGLPEYYREDLHFVKSVADATKAEPDFCSAMKVDKIIEDVVSGES
jgi:predicted dehydrogenase